MSGYAFTTWARVERVRACGERLREEHLGLSYRFLL